MVKCAATGLSLPLTGGITNDRYGIMIIGNEQILEMM